MGSPSAARVAGAAPASGARPLRLQQADDAQLVIRATSGDRWAREAIFRKHVEYLVALAVRLLRDHAEAEDAVQDAFLEAFQRFDQLRDPAQLRAWLAGITVHKVHRRFRRRRVLSFFGLRRPRESVGLEEAVHARVSVEVRADLAYLDVVLSGLRDEVRAAWILRYVQGYRFEEISAACRCSLATAKRRVAQAHALVRQHMQVLQVEDDDE